MKARILLTALMVTMLSLTVGTKANAHPWHHFRGGWGGPHVRVFVPPIPIPAPRVVVNAGYYDGGYCAPRYSRNCGNRYYDRAYYGGGGYCRPQRYYGHSYGNGNGYYGHHYRR